MFRDEVNLFHTTRDGHVAVQKGVTVVYLEFKKREV
jgi:hypothetical protein